MEHIIEPARQGIFYIISLINEFALFPFPGTDIPVVLIAIGVWAIYFLWRWVLAQLFDIEVKK